MMPAELDAFVQEDLSANRHYAAEADPPAEDDPMDWAVVHSARVSQSDDGSLELRLVKGPGAVAGKRSVAAIGRELVGKLAQAFPGVQLRTRIDPAPGFPAEWMDAIRDEAEHFLADSGAPASGIVPALVAGGQIELVWDAEDDTDPAVFDAVVPRIKARLPALADYEITHSIG